MIQLAKQYYPQTEVKQFSVCSAIVLPAPGTLSHLCVMYIVPSVKEKEEFNNYGDIWEPWYTPTLVQNCHSNHCLHSHKHQFHCRNTEEHETYIMYTTQSELDRVLFYSRYHILTSGSQILYCMQFDPFSQELKKFGLNPFVSGFPLDPYHQENSVFVVQPITYRSSKYLIRIVLKTSTPVVHTGTITIFP